MILSKISEAVAVLSSARSLIITAGAGMGVDSGLPDFRGPQGFWRAYPMYQQLGIDFVDAANPRHFADDPAFAWGFYGHRTHLYRQTRPHRGFKLLRNWIDRYSLRCFVVTSNVDGQFQKAGFAEGEILEVHGSIHHLQCTVPCGDDIWDSGQQIDIDNATLQAKRFPHCLHCGSVARPNILMFGDSAWLNVRAAGQRRHFDRFLTNVELPLLVIELGAGTAIATIRHLSEHLTYPDGCSLVRINPREAQVPMGQISLPMGALEGLALIEAALQ